MLPPRDGAKKKEKHPGPASEALSVPQNAQWSEQQQAAVEALTKEYASKIDLLQKELASVLTDEQQRARHAGQKKALAEGKKGVALRAAADAAAGMTGEQSKQVQDLRQAIGRLTREYRAKRLEVLKGNTQ